jgi:iron complex outermembrane recepter protein
MSNFSSLRRAKLDERGNQCQRARVSKKLIFIFLLSVSMPALAQRTTNNAVTTSDDAFGRAVGSEKIGIYSTEDVRGFSPVEASNVRIEGMYFDQQSQPSQRLVDSSSIRVGYSALGYPFPAPTGIADLRIEKFEGRRVFSIDAEHEDRANLTGSIAAKIPLAGAKFGVALGFGFRTARIPQGRNGNFNSAALALTWLPYQGAEISAFSSRFHFSKGQAQPVLFPIAGVVPRRIDRRLQLGQPWALSQSTGMTHGFVAKLPLGAFKLDAGLFRSTKSDPIGFADLLIGTSADNVAANHVIIADDDNRNGSTSGEVRLTRTWQTEKLRHALSASVKGRNQSRFYGGQQRIILGVGPAGVPDARPAPAFAFGDNDRSSVRQMTFGLGYDVRWKGRGSLSLAVQKSNYRKQTQLADPASPQLESRDRPWLFSANGAANVTHTLTVYGGYVRGLEESPVAPDVATNRNEAPPAIRTSQRDAGLRYALSPKLSVIGGIFEVRKPYFNLDVDRRFRQLGTVRNRGVELSLAGSVIPGLNLVAGTLFLSPQISGAEVASGRIGARPVGSFRRHSIANLDWKPRGQAAWSFDLAFDSFSRSTANTANSFEAPARTTIGLGTRYRFALGKTAFLVRGQIQNVFDGYGWKVSSSGGFTYILPRTFSLNLAADF